MQLVVVVLMDALGPELVLEFASVESGLSQLDLQSAPLGLQLVSVEHVESVVVLAWILALFICAIQTNFAKPKAVCFDYCLVFPTSFRGFLHLASSMQLAVVVLVVLELVVELVVELVLALGLELVLEFAPIELGLSQLDLQSALLGL
ncbi:hypothetical protein Tco_0935922 [Tanacetum coccineum]